VIIRSIIYRQSAKRERTKTWKSLIVSVMRRVPLLNVGCGGELSPVCRTDTVCLTPPPHTTLGWPGLPTQDAASLSIQYTQLVCVSDATPG